MLLREATFRAWTSTVTVDREAATIEVDLRDNADQMNCGLNVSEACTRTAAYIGVFNSIDHTVPKNAGSLRRVKLHLKDAGVVGIPRFLRKKTHIISSEIGMQRQRGNHGNPAAFCHGELC